MRPRLGGHVAGSVHQGMPTKNVLLFFFNDTATTEIYTLSLHDALPISSSAATRRSTSCCRGSPRSSNSYGAAAAAARSEEHTSELQSHSDLVCRLLLEKKQQHPMAHRTADQALTVC